jgi:hypothetical protein
MRKHSVVERNRRPTGRCSVRLGLHGLRRTVDDREQLVQRGDHGYGGRRALVAGQGNPVVAEVVHPVPAPRTTVYQMAYFPPAEYEAAWAHGMLNATSYRDHADYVGRPSKPCRR